MKVVVLGAIIAAIAIAIGLILLGLVGDFLVDWAWFFAIGYPSVFWTVVGAKAIVFVAFFTVSAVFLWLNGSFARRQRPPRSAGWKRRWAGCACSKLSMPSWSGCAPRARPGSKSAGASASPEPPRTGVGGTRLAAYRLNGRSLMPKRHVPSRVRGALTDAEVPIVAALRCAESNAIRRQTYCGNRGIDPFDPKLPLELQQVFSNELWRTGKPSRRARVVVPCMHLFQRRGCSSFVELGGQCRSFPQTCF